MPVYISVYISKTISVFLVPSSECFHQAPNILKNKGSKMRFADAAEEPFWVPKVPFSEQFLQEPLLLSIYFSWNLELTQKKFFVENILPLRPSKM